MLKQTGAHISVAPSFNLKAWLRDAYKKQFGMMKYCLIATVLSLLVTVISSIVVVGLSESNFIASVAGLLASYSFYPLLMAVAYKSGGLAVLGQQAPSFYHSTGRKLLIAWIIAISGGELLWMASYLAGQNMLFHLGVSTGAATALAHAITTSGMSVIIPPIKHLIELWTAP